MTPRTLTQQLVELEVSLTDVGKTPRRVGLQGNIPVWTALTHEHLSASSLFGKFKEQEQGRKGSCHCGCSVNPADNRECLKLSAVRKLWETEITLNYPTLAVRKERYLFTPSHCLDGVDSVAFLASQWVSIVGGKSPQAQKCRYWQLEMGSQPELLNE